MHGLPSLFLVVSLVGCVRTPATDDTAPATDDTASAPLEVTCGSVPLAAVDTWFEHTAVATGGEGARWFVADGLPPGMGLAYGTGRIHGRPEEVGTYDVRLRVGDASGARAETVCPIEVRPTFAIDLAPLYTRSAWCLAPGESVLDLLVAGTGDGSPVTCTVGGDSADGRLPAGLSVNEATCAVEGTLAETTYGNWAFIVRAEQAGEAVFAPYCVAQTTTPGRYQIVVKHSGRDDGAGVAWSEAVPPRETLSAAVEAPDALPFTVLDPEGCPDGCYYSAWWTLERSAVSSSTMGVAGLEAVSTGSRTIGLRHGFVIDRAYLREDLYTRPFVVQLDFVYCLTLGASDCATYEQAQDKGDPFAFAMVFLPEPPVEEQADTGGG